MNSHRTQNPYHSTSPPWLPYILATIRRKFCNTFRCSVFGPCHGSGSWSPAFHRTGTRSIPDQSTWDLWWTKWHCMYQVLWRVFRFSPVSIVPPMLHTSIYVVILSSEGRAGEEWEPSKKAVLFLSQGTH